MACFQNYTCVGLVICMLTFIYVNPAAGACANDTECGAHGTCPDTTKDCNCTGGYTGATCNKAPICTDGGSECGDHGSCNTSGSTYECTCTASYSGAKCADACTSSGGECGDHGTCTTSTTPNECTCKDDYTGDQCKTAPKSSAPLVHLSVVLMASSLLWSFVM